MGPVNIPDRDVMYMRWIENFAVKAAEFADEYGFSPEEVAEMADLAEAYAEAYQASELARIAAMSATAAKRDARARSEELFRAMARRTQATESIPSDMKAILGMGTEKAAPSPVETPSDLIVSGDELGVNRLKWKSNGNSRSVTYIIEARVSGESEWRIISVTSSLKFQHTGQIPGREIAYRVSAKRSRKQSVPCVAVVAYADSGVMVVPLPVAA